MARIRCRVPCPQSLLAGSEDCFCRGRCPFCGRGTARGGVFGRTCPIHIERAARRARTVPTALTVCVTIVTTITTVIPIS
jgi:hypothetical protein